ncbi:MAG: tyrosine-type recombinase/integrase [Candidatus Kapabacteria bacterium]|nr:tyrosine-type recombinase/integrase [Candidatus Kapabacteria bacterium]
MNFKYYLQGKRIRLYIRYNRNAYPVSTDLSIDPKFWDSKEGKPKNAYPERIELQSYLDNFKSRISKEIIKFIDNNPKYSYEEIKEVVKSTLQKKEITGFFDKFREFNELHKDKSISWHKKYNSILVHLKEFEALQKITKKDFKITYHSIDLSFFQKLQNFYIDVKKHNNNNIRKNLQFIRVFLQWSEDNGIQINQSYHKFKLNREEERDIIFITEEELLSIFNYDFSDNERYDHARDLFILQCATGLRISDLKRITKDNIKNGFIEIRQQKTSNFVTIPLTPYSEIILNKYDVLPSISEVELNRTIKQVCKDCGLNEIITISSKSGNKLNEEKFEKWQKISSKIGRSTFASLNLAKGVPEHIVKSMTGHKDSRAFAKYVGVSKQIQKEATEKAWRAPTDDGTIIKIIKHQHKKVG